MTTRNLDARRFSMADQEWFAELSADRNPLHVDPVAARRSLFGRVVVHGVHTVLWALESWLERRVPAGAVRRIKAQFLKPVFPGEEVTVSVAGESAGETRIQVTDATGALVSLTVLCGAGPPTPRALPTTAPPPRSEPRDRAFAELREATGCLTLFINEPAANSRFSKCMGHLGSAGVAELVALSRLVGMECPGLHSLFSSMDLDFTGRGSAAAGLSWKVERCDVPFAPIRIGVTSAGCGGSVAAFYRPAPTLQPGLSRIADAVHPDEFAGQVALIVGGSRGLGECTAKIVAAGGGYPVITWLHGERDGHRVRDEIRAAGRRCEGLQLDALHPAAGMAELSRRNLVPTHLYYFATPRITRTRGATFDSSLFREFDACYVEAFFRVCTLAGQQPGAALRVFYPSTVFLDGGSRDNPEYVAAKEAGERMCAHMNRSCPGMSILVERLPRIATDQTATLLKTASADALEVLLPIVRRLHHFAPPAVGPGKFLPRGETP